MNKILITIYIVFLLVLTAIFSTYPLIFLTSNQILYLYSVAAQVVGGLFGLTIAGYVYHKNQNDHDMNSTPELEMIVTKMNNISHRRIISITIFGLLSIFSSLLSISVINIECFWSNALYNLSMLCIVLELIMLFVFAISMTNPEARKKFCQKRVLQLSKNEKGTRFIYVKILELQISIMNYCYNLENELIKEKTGIVKRADSDRSMFYQLEMYGKIDEDTRDTLVGMYNYIIYIRYAELRIGHKSILEDLTKMVERLHIPVRNLEEEYEEDTGKHARIIVRQVEPQKIGNKKKRRKY